ncbi:protein LEAD-SENSITIVE 1-like [Malus sylvestris]|uniref:protein LEAD-SENSITIVE 1-like n=1 Tax=Malus sylvestris TaxID=3752 RepID=UPI0021AC73CF|nr:protein LEAD-SENSITIVE 1-like [Malus sylvestris]
MSLLSNRISKEELQPGDHIYTYRKLHTYSHHGIYVGEGRVIHFFKTKGKGKISSKRKPRCSDCKNDPNTARGVVKTCVDCFLKGHGLFRFEYNVSHNRFNIKNRGTCSTESCYPGGETVRRASEIFDKDPTHGTGFGEYNLLNNNCEDFASYCKRGTSVSEQAVRVWSVGNSFADSTNSSSTSSAASPSRIDDGTTSKAAFLISKATSFFSSES